MKRSNGTGSITKLSGNRRKPYIIRVSAWEMEDGVLKRKRKVVGSYATLKDALKHIGTLTASEDVETIRQKSSRVTFKDCADESLARAETTLDETTMKSYQNCLNTLKPLWNIRMQNLTGEVYQQFVDKLIREGTKAKRLSNINIVTRRAVKVAIRKGIITNDPTKGTDIGGSVRIPDRERTAFSHEEITKLWLHSTDPMAREILVMIYTGLRANEYLSVGRKDVDLSEKTINIRDSKTKAGVRKTPIADCIFPFVETNVKEHHRLSAYNTYSPFRKWFVRYCKQLGMDHIPHETRHTFATLLDEARLPDGFHIDITVTKVLIGHKVTDITKGTYTHENYERLRQAINCLQTKW